MADFTITKGDTFSRVWQWGTDVFTYKAITGIAKSAPARVTCVGHGVPADWPVAIVSVNGMTKINAATFPPKTKDFHVPTIIGVDTLDFNLTDSSGYSTYTSGGYVMFNTPVDLTGYTARAQVKDKVGGTVLLDLTAYLVVDNAAKTITVTVSATLTAALTWTKGVFDLEMVSSGGVVTKIDAGKITVAAEVTT